MPPTLQDALQHHQGGDLPRAAQLYRELLTAEPRHADAYHLLGVLMHQLQHHQVAVELVNHAIQLQEGFAPYHNNLGNALLALGKREEARASFQRSLRLSRSADTYINLATLDLGDGRIPEAKAEFKAALRLFPKQLASLVGLARIAMMEEQNPLAKRLLEKALSVDSGCVPALNILGDLYLKEERLHDAEVSFTKASESLPSDVDAHLRLGHLYMRLERYASAAESYGKAYRLSPQSHGTAILLGVAYLMDEDTQAAKAIFEHARELDDRHPSSHHLLGSALVQGREYEQALASFHCALLLDPSMHEAMNGMGNAYDGLGDYRRADPLFQAALALDPQNPTYLQNVGINFARQGDRRAIGFLDQAIALAPNDAKIHIALAESLLLFGDYKRGFAEYEWRWRSASFSKPHRRYDAPVWDGSPLTGKTILLHAEQGLGDTIQFIRFLPQVARFGGTIILVVQPRLRRLFQALNSTAVCLGEGDPLPAFDVHCPLLSLPAVLGTEFQTIPGSISLGMIVHKERPPHSEMTMNVGLAWAGNPKHARDSLRSLPFASFLPLREVTGCKFFSLQKNVPESDAAALLAFRMDSDEDGGQDLLDTAYAMGDLDLIISVDTSVAHLAATLGKRVWLILQEAADWRWGTEGDTTPWYPTMKLFRRRAGESNTDLMESIVQALSRWPTQQSLLVTGGYEG